MTFINRKRICKGYTLKDLAPIVIMLVIASIVTSVGTEVVSNVRDVEEDMSSNIVTVSNESINFAANNTWYGLVELYYRSLTSVMNASHDINTANFTAEKTGYNMGRIKLVSTTGAGNANISTGTYYVTYTHEAGTHAWNISSQGLESLETIGDWIPTVALVIAAVIVIGVIVLYFGKLGAK